MTALQQTITKAADLPKRKRRPIHCVVCGEPSFLTIFGAPLCAKHFFSFTIPFLFPVMWLASLWSSWPLLVETFDMLKKWGAFDTPEGIIATGLAVGLGFLFGLAMVWAFTHDR
jgi:hypothetical protein